MDYRENALRAAKYLEDRLKGEASMDEAAAEARYSTYHFYRVFLGVAGASPAAYLRKRRLSEAARDIASGHRRILDAALEYGFGSQESFTRAFKDEFGLTPGECARAGTTEGLALTESLLLRPDLRDGGSTMQFKTVKKDAMLMAGYPCYGGTLDPLFGQMWEKFNASPSAKLLDGSEGCFGLEFFDDPGMDSGKFFYMAAGRIARIEELPEDMVAKYLPAGEYAVFEHRGAVSSLPATITRAYSEALPAAGLEPAGRFDFERYGERFTSPVDPDSVTEVWVPVRKKA